jgi:Spy/CpxP family protein refolding chaperone
MIPPVEPPLDDPALHIFTLQTEAGNARRLNCCLRIPPRRFITTFEEQNMSEQTTDNNSRCPANRKHRLGRRARMTVAVVTLVGAGAVLGAAATAQAARMGGWHGMGHHWSARSEEQIRERALDKAAWALGRIDASPEQETRINAIVSALVGDLYSLRGEHREHRRQLISALARPQVDRGELEKIRTGGMALADSASRAMLNAVADATETLTIEQREELAAMIGRHREE